MDETFSNLLLSKNEEGSNFSKANSLESENAIEIVLTASPPEDRIELQSRYNRECLSPISNMDFQFWASSSGYTAWPWAI